MITEIDKALKDLLVGKPIGLPTETVYGLAANAFDTASIDKIFSLKNRPAFNPLIIHVASIDQAQKIAHFSKEALTLATALWPGPLTLVLPLLPPEHADKAISPRVTAGLKTIAIRCPDHPIAQEVLSRVDFPLAAPSANISESVSPTTSQHVLDAFPELSILEGGPCRAGIESTIVDVSSDSPVILRPGTITAEDIAEILQKNEVPHLNATSDTHIKAPGQMLRHYAPRLPLRMNAETVLPGEALLAFGPTDLEASVVKNLSPHKNLADAAAQLFALLRELDQLDVTGIAVTPIPNEGIGHAINDRLKRASSKS